MIRRMPTLPSHVDKLTFVHIHIIPEQVVKELEEGDREEEGGEGEGEGRGKRGERRREGRVSLVFQAAPLVAATMGEEPLEVQVDHQNEVSSIIVPPK